MSISKLNDPKNWECRLRGESLPIYDDGTFEFGYWRVKSPDRTTWLGLRTYFGSDDKIRWVLDGARVEPSFNKWIEASQNPITEELYDLVITGSPWPDQNEVVTRLSNNPPDDSTFEGCQAAINELVEEAELLIKAGGAKTKGQADQAARVADELARYHKRADMLREQEKAAPLEKCRQIEARWKPLLAAAELHKRLKQIVVLPWLAREKAEKERKEAEAREVARKAAEAAKRAQDEANRKIIEATKTANAKASEEAAAETAKAEAAIRAAAEAAQTARSLEQKTITAGTLGRRAVHLRMKKVYGFTDRDAVMSFFRDHEDVDEFYLKLAAQADKAGIKVPGLKITEEPMAA